MQIFSTSSTDLALDGLTLTGGSTGGSGGAVSSIASVTLTNTVVSGNSAGGSGGGIRAGTATVTNSTISGNGAGGSGGGISASTATFTNTTVSGNLAEGIGGGIRATTATLTNSTVSGNSTGSDGGGIFATIEATLTNSIVLGNNAALDGDEIFGTASYTGLNIVGVGADTNDGDGVINASSVGAVFATIDGATGGGQLADNGGPVQTIALKDDLSNPALDKSNGSAPATDARGEAREDWAGIANQNGSPADLGAFELQNTAPAATNLTQAKAYLEDAASIALDDIDGGATDTQTILVTVGDVDGATITGTKGRDKVNATKTVKGEPLPTGEEDQIVGKSRKDKLSGLDGDDTITGGGGRDVLKGGAGDDTLAGGAGHDKYIGGDGIDAFVFDTKVTPKSRFDHLSIAALNRRVDKIVDYEKDEKIILDSDVFKGLSKGALGADQFHIGEAAEAATHRILYDESAGNGSAVAGEAVIARIGKNLGHLDHNDILVA